MIAPGFEAVAEVFERAARDQPGGGLAFAATVEGEAVVDLVGGVARPGQPWSHDTRAVVMSVTKGWAIMCAQILFDRGLLTPDTPVVDLWPEFGAAGKERTLVGHIFEHSAGVLGVPDVASLVQWDGGGWSDLDAIAARLAAARPAWEPGTRYGYHAVTFGWLMGELVRRTDGRTLGRFFHDEIATPLGIRSAIGVPRAEQGDIAVLLTKDLMTGPLLLRPVFSKVPRMMRDPSTLIGQAFLGDGTRSIMDSVDDAMVDGRFLEAEVPSSNGVSSAADLARLYAPLANGGALGDLRLFSPESMALFLRPTEPQLDSVMGEFATMPILGRIIRQQATGTRSVGGYEVNRKRGRRQSYGPNERTVGNGGAGGQFAFADPDNRASAGFVRTALSMDMKPLLALIASLYDCLGARRPGAVPDPRSTG